MFFNVLRNVCSFRYVQHFTNLWSLVPFQPSILAVIETCKRISNYFMLFSDEKITLESNDTDGNEEFDEEVLHMRQLLKTKLVDMDLSVRALNCLKAADVETLGDLVQFNKTDACAILLHQTLHCHQYHYFQAWSSRQRTTWSDKSEFLQLLSALLSDV